MSPFRNTCFWGLDWSEKFITLVTNNIYDFQISPEEKFTYIAIYSISFMEVHHALWVMEKSTFVMELPRSSAFDTNEVNKDR